MRYQTMQVAEDYPTREETMPEPRDTFEAPARSSGRMPHMVLAFEAVSLAMKCRVSHPKLSLLLEDIGNHAIAEQRADDQTPAFLAGRPARGVTPQETFTAADLAHQRAELEPA